MESDDVQSARGGDDGSGVDRSRCRLDLIPRGSPFHDSRLCVRPTPGVVVWDSVYHRLQMWPAFALPDPRLQAASKEWPGHLVSYERVGPRVAQCEPIHDPC